MWQSLPTQRGMVLSKIEAYILYNIMHSCVSLSLGWEESSL